MIVIDIVVTILLGITVLYAILKEREELGCYRVSIGQQCDDDGSVYLKNTKMSSTDTRNDKIERLKSIVSYHEKGAVWRRCVLLSIISVLIVYIMYRVQPVFQYHSYLLLVLLNFTILYFYHNYINYHHFRRLKNNGVEILETLKQD